LREFSKDLGIDLIRFVRIFLGKIFQKSNRKPRKIDQKKKRRT